MTETMTRAVLPAPSRELAEHATRRVDWADRFRAYRMAAGAGTVAEDLYSFAEIGRFFLGTDWELSDDMHAKTAFNWIDMTKLASWLEDVAGDKVLADAVRENAAEDRMALRSQVEQVGPILVERFAQYRSALETDGQDTE